MKKLFGVLLVFLFLLIAQNSEAKVQHRNGKGHSKPIGAPIDGGLLTILGAGGVIYYFSRKKAQE
jgi:hypothetical protein